MSLYDTETFPLRHGALSGSRSSPRRGTFTGGAALADFGHGLSERELRLLSARDVNGRQIKNAVRTASALAESMQEQLGFKHIESVLDMMAEFEIEMNAAREELE